MDRSTTSCSGSDRVRRRGQRLPAAAGAGVPQRPRWRHVRCEWPAAPGGVVTNTNYASTVDVVDADPRIISNLIVDQTVSNPAAVAAAAGNDGAQTVVSPGLDGVFGTADDRRCLLHSERHAGRGAVGAASTPGSRSSASSSTTASIWSTRAATARSYSAAGGRSAVRTRPARKPTSWC